MILRYYPTRDTTLYENEPERNAGIDQVLELVKVPATASVSTVSTDSFNSRMILDFDYQHISASIAALGYDPNQFDFSIRLYATEAEEIPSEYTIETFALSGSWNMGLGRATTQPANTEGAGWYYRVGTTDPLQIWATESYAANVTASWMINPGGGNWYTSSMATQSFEYTTTDLNIDVTTIMREVQSGSFDFNGFVIKKDQTTEQNAQRIKALRFYSKETQTIYAPVLEAKFDDSVDTSTTTTAIDVEEEFNITATSLRQIYKEGARPKIVFNPWYRFPASTYQTSSLFLDIYKLPPDTQYAIYYAHSDDVVIDFSEYTKVSHNDKGSYIKLHLDSFQPERYYRILLKVPLEDGVSYDIYDQHWIFKVERN